MGRINRDVVVAVALMFGCGVFFWASLDIREPDYGTLAPATWPQVILAYLLLLCVVYLGQSLRAGSSATAKARGETKSWLERYRNPLWCYALFLLFLFTLPALGMLIGGVLFVFLLLCVIGGFSPRNLVVHAAIALVMVGAMWALFTFGLGVILPQGKIFTVL